jgi:hypothetical protein
MAIPRSKCLSTVTPEDYAMFEVLAAHQSVSAWARGIDPRREAARCRTGATGRGVALHHSNLCSRWRPHAADCGRHAPADHRADADKAQKALERQAVIRGSR